MEHHARHIIRPKKREIPIMKLLNSKCSDPLVKQVIKDLMKVCADNTDTVRVSLVTVEGSTNVFCDSQLSVYM